MKLEAIGRGVFIGVFAAFFVMGGKLLAHSSFLGLFVCWALLIAGLLAPVMKIYTTLRFSEAVEWYSGKERARHLFELMMVAVSSLAASFKMLHASALVPQVGLHALGEDAIFIFAFGTIAFANCYAFFVGFIKGDKD